MKKLMLISIAITLFSCGYNLKTDREIAISNNELLQTQEKLNEAKLQYEQLKDSLDREAKKLIRFKDSIKFMDLTRIMCYQTGEHRHSCQVYGDRFVTAANEANDDPTDITNRDQTEVAVNE